MTTRAQLAELHGAAHLILQRAQGQHGRIELPVKLETIEDALPLGNAGTLFDFDWEVRANGRLLLRAYIDGVPFGEAVI